MKKTVTIIGICLAFASCNNAESNMKNEIKQHIDSNAKDPKSYEFVEIKIIDTVTNSELSKFKISYKEMNIEFLKTNIELNNSIIKDLDQIDAQEYIDKNSIAKNSIIKLEQEALNLKKSLNDKEIVGFIAKHKFRIKNGFGALDLNEMFVKFDKNLKFIKMDKNKEFESIELVE